MAIDLTGYSGYSQPQAMATRQNQLWSGTIGLGAGYLTSGMANMCVTVPAGTTINIQEPGERLYGIPDTTPLLLLCKS